MSISDTLATRELQINNNKIIITRITRKQEQQEDDEEQEQVNLLWTQLSLITLHRSTAFEYAFHQMSP